MSEVKTVGLVGGGVIGGGWAARCLANGLDVIAYDPAPNGEAILRGKVANAWPALTRIGLHPDASQDRLRMASSIEEVAAASDLVQESVPERLDLKIRIHSQIDAAAAPDVLICSSTSGLLPSDFQAECKHPERVLVGHPFNPVYLLPLVEIVGGKKTAQEARTRAGAFYEKIGMYPVQCRTEVEGFLSDRLQEALWRENLHMLAEGHATTKEMDDVVVYGPGLRWAFMGVNRTFALAGGDQGMRHFMEQFGPALKLPWTKLEAPELTEELIDTVVKGTEEQLADITIPEMEQLRDNCLIEIMEALSKYREGAGEVLLRLREKNQ
ncbi:MAG: L-carnitine dehydrogenase [Alphaproteobacteria bacterium]|nr:L-carnitine dehydrogenase [Alphaproteobacteria bacterium]MBO6865128.1 L-carnitine dehydrogenase [Alphaproteobacteria bacterium]